MRALGLLFVLLLAVGVLGWFRGWFGVQTSHAADRDRVDLVVDRDRIEDDARTAADKVGELTKRAAEAVKRAAHRVAGEDREIETEVLEANASDRRLRVSLDGESVDLTVPRGATLVAHGESISFATLRPGVRVRITIVDRDDRLIVTRVERV